MAIGLAVVGLVVGWWVFWFLCDDAFIAFRYVKMRQLGHGYVWNPAPFHPVEGYSSFLWVALLDLTWQVTGRSPPETANPWGLVFGLVQLGLTVKLFDGLVLSRLARHRDWLLAVVLAGVVSNRTFLAWTSSGLETSLFDALVLGWLWAGLQRRVGVFVLCGALLELARPDGWLFVAASVPVLVLWGRARWVAALLVLPFAHEAWRIWTYGAWLPNTYYAKVAAPWPSMGAVYLGSFLLEYGFWLWIPLGLRLAWGVWRDPPHWGWPTVLARWIVGGTLAFQVAYYTFRIGGDHFEYRVYAWTVPVVWVGAIAALDRLQWRPSRAAFGLVAMLLAGLPLPWMLWYQTHDIEVRHQRGMPRYKVAEDFPWPVRPPALLFDLMQGYMIRHFVGMRFQTHKIYLGYQRSRFPDEDEGFDIHGVMRHTSVGYPAWTLPHVAIIDEMGLNDAIIARNPEPRHRGRLMAHERKPPPGYVPCFRPNVRFDKKGRLVDYRPYALDAAAIRACEARGWESLGLRPLRE